MAERIRTGSELLEAPQTPLGASAGTAPWHTTPVNEALERQGSAPTGLTQAEATKRLETYGPNRLPGSASRALVEDAATTAPSEARP